MCIRDRSKADPLEKSSIYLDDSEKIIRKKIASAVTDSDGIIKFDPIHKPGISNLLSIMSCCTGKMCIRDRLCIHYI